MKKTLKLITGTLFFISFLCMLAYGGHTAGQQLLWSFGWMAICAISGRAFYKLSNNE